MPLVTLQFIWSQLLLAIHSSYPFHEVPYRRQQLEISDFLMFSLFVFFSYSYPLQTIILYHFLAVSGQWDSCSWHSGMLNCLRWLEDQVTPRTMAQWILCLICYFLMRNSHGAFLVNTILYFVSMFCIYSFEIFHSKRNDIKLDGLGTPLN